MPRPPAVAGPRAHGADAPVRAFFALWPDPDADAALAVLARDVAARMQGRAAIAENLHLTLAFLGDVAPSRAEALHAIGAAVAAQAAPFRLTLDRVGTFRGTGIAWAGTSATPPELERLARNLGDALAADGFAIERRAFHTHVTLARRCRARGEATATAPIAWTVARLTLNASDLSSGVPRYRELAGWALAPKSADDHRGSLGG